MRVLLTFILLLLASVSFAKTWMVNQMGELTSIKRAIEIANAGDTIVVSSGIYQEGNILVDKSLVLIGKDHPVVDGVFKYEVFTVTANDVTILNFKIINVGRSSMHDQAAIGGENVRRLHASGNEIENAFLEYISPMQNHV